MLSVAYSSIPIPCPPSGAASSHTGQLRQTPNRDPNFNWTRNLSSILRRRDGSGIELREIEVPYTAGKPVGFSLSRFLFITDSFSHTGKLHAKKKKPNVSSFRSPNTYTTQQSSGATQTCHHHSSHLPLLLLRHLLQSLEKWDSRGKYKAIQHHIFGFERTGHTGTSDCYDGKLTMTPIDRDPLN